jgi:hypothetical protein
VKKFHKAKIRVRQRPVVVAGFQRTSLPGCGQIRAEQWPDPSKSSQILAIFAKSGRTSVILARSGSINGRILLNIGHFGQIWPDPGHFG